MRLLITLQAHDPRPRAGASFLRKPLLLAVLLSLLLCVSLPAQANTVILWTSDGYRSASPNDEGYMLLLGTEQKVVEGIAENTSATYILIDQDIRTPWRGSIGGNGTDTLNAAVAAGKGWLAVGSSSSSDLQNGWHEGYYDAFEGKSDGWVVRIDPYGEVLWNWAYGGSDWDSFNAVCPTEDGGFILVGETYSMDGDVEGWHESGALQTEPDAWVVCIDDNGAILWQRTLGGGGYDAAYDIAAIDGGYMVVGVTGSQDGDVKNNLGEGDGWLILLDAEGNLLDEMVFGGAGEDALTTIARGEDENAGFLLAAGYTWSDLPQGRGCDGWAICVDLEGALQWEKRFGNGDSNYTMDSSYSKNFWAMAGFTPYEEDKTSEWIYGIKHDGSAASLVRGAF